MEEGRAAGLLLLLGAPRAGGKLTPLFLSWNTFHLLLLRNFLLPGFHNVALLCLLSIPEVVTKYSNFISFPLYLNGRRINTLQVSWRATGRSLMETQNYYFSGFFTYSSCLSQVPC